MKKEYDFSKATRSQIRGGDLKIQKSIEFDVDVFLWIEEQARQCDMTWHGFTNWLIQKHMSAARSEQSPVPIKTRSKKAI